MSLLLVIRRFARGYKTSTGHFCPTHANPLGGIRVFESPKTTSQYKRPTRWRFIGLLYWLGLVDMFQTLPRLSSTVLLFFRNFDRWGITKNFNELVAIIALQVVEDLPGYP